MPVSNPSRDPGGNVARPSGRTRVTVREVAAAAGVSVGTVSHVISGRRHVAPSTRSRVEAAIATLGYRPNRLARSLQTRRSHVIGMVIPDVGNPFFGELARAVEREARAAGYCVVFGNSENDPDLETRYVEEFVERRVDGLIAVANVAGWAKRVPMDLAVVALDRYPPRWPFDAVRVDNEAGMEVIVGHLVGLGHERIGFIGGDQVSTAGLQRARGFARALRHRNLEPAWLSTGMFSLESGRLQTERLLARPPRERPTAIVAANDLLALGALLACQQAGVAVPEELSVAGFDDIPFAALARPSLTTVRQPIDELGAQATRLVLERIQGNAPTSPRRVVLRPWPVVRASTAPPADARQLRAETVTRAEPPAGPGPADERGRAPEALPTVAR